MENNKSSFTLELQEAFNKIVQMRAAGLEVTRYSLALRLFPGVYTTVEASREAFARLVSLESLNLIKRVEYPYPGAKRYDIADRLKQ